MLVNECLQYINIHVTNAVFELFHLGCTDNAWLTRMFNILFAVHFVDNNRPGGGEHIIIFNYYDKQF